MMEKGGGRVVITPIQVSTLNDKNSSGICIRCIRGMKACSLRPAWPICTCAAFKPMALVLDHLEARWRDFQGTDDFRERMEKAREIERLNVGDA